MCETKANGPTIQTGVVSAWLPFSLCWQRYKTRYTVIRHTTVSTRRQVQLIRYHTPGLYSPSFRGSILLSVCLRPIKWGQTQPTPYCSCHDSRPAHLKVMFSLQEIRNSDILYRLGVAPHANLVFAVSSTWTQWTNGRKDYGFEIVSSSHNDPSTTWHFSGSGCKLRVIPSSLQGAFNANILYAEGLISGRCLVQHMFEKYNQIHPPVLIGDT